MRRELFENLPIGQYFHKVDDQTTYQKVIEERADAWCYVGRHYIHITNILNIATGERRRMLGRAIVNPIGK